MIELKTASDSTQEHQPRLNFVEIAFARSRREALSYRAALIDASIAAEIESGGNAHRGIAVLVESANLVAATELLATLAQDKAASNPLGYDDEDDDEFEDDDDFSDDDDDFDDDDDEYFDDDEDRDDEDDDYEDDDDE